MKTTIVEPKPVRVVTVGVLLCGMASVFFFWIWYRRYLRIEFNELGRYFDIEAQVVYTDAAFVWCFPAFACLGFSLGRMALGVWRRRANALR